jgi:acetolactate synthase-1/2/3 large subunit
MKVRQGISDALVAEGVEVVFGLMGDGNLELICDLAERCGVEIVLGRHEQGVVAMADGYARATGKLAVATVTQGPGLTNTSTSLVVAERRRCPVLLLAGEAPLGATANPQWLDQGAAARSLVTTVARVESVASLGECLATAFTALHGGRPCVLNLPDDVQGMELPEGWQYRRRFVQPQPTRPAAPVIDAVVTRLSQAKRPALLGGLGAVKGKAGPAMRRIADLLDAPLMTTLLANGLFAGHALDMGICGGLGDGRALRELVDCDVLLAVGASLNQWTTHFDSALKDLDVIQVDNDACALRVANGTDYLAVQGDAGATCAELIETLEHRIANRKVTEPRKHAALEPRDERPYEDTEYTIDPRHVLAEIDGRLPEARRVVVGGGHVAQVACFMLPASAPEDWTCTSVDFGAIGQGLAVAIGACFADRSRRVYHITGDGDFMMGLAELDTAVRHALSLTVLVLNDQGMGQERHNLVRAEFPAAYADYTSIDLAKLGDAFGATGYRIDGPQDLPRVQRAVSDHTGVVVVDVRVNGHYLNPVSKEIAEKLDA